MKIAFVLAAFAAVASARMAYQLTAGFEDIVGLPVTSFSCEGRPYGYYADIDNDCKIFHVCVPVVDELGQLTRTDHFSFICGNNTMFSQEYLACIGDTDGVPCNEAATLYDVVNAEFGRIPEQEFQN